MGRRDEAADPVESDEVDEYGEQEDRKQVLEEYRIWKKNAPFLYDLVVTHAVEWPSLTVQWLQRVSRPEGKEYSEHELLLGTHTNDDGQKQQNHVIISKVRLPNADTNLDARHYDDEKGELGGWGGSGSKVETKVRLNHDGDVHRARYMPQDDYIVATTTVAGNVDVFFVRDHESAPSQDGPAVPNVRLTGQSEGGGYGLDWNLLQRGRIASSSDEGQVCVWDLPPAGGAAAGSEGFAPLLRFQAHRDGSAGDVQWSKRHADIFASVGDDRRLCIFDARQIKAAPPGSGELAKPKSEVEAHGKEVQALCWSYHHEFLLATGGNDHVVKLWDLRDISTPVHCFAGHTGDIFKVEWAPFSAAVLASCGDDRRVHVWDLGRIGQEQTAEDAEDGPPELLFVHGGHTARVSDISWNPNDAWVMASVSDDNVVQIWQMAENIYHEEADADKDKVLDREIE